MPLYEFRCSECTNHRDVRASFADADVLVLVCLECGAEMRKVLSGSFSINLSTPAASPPPASRRARQRAHVCSDDAVKLARPNPFRRDLPKNKTDSEDRIT